MNRKVMKVLSIVLSLIIVMAMLSTAVFASTDLTQFNNKGNATATATSFQNVIGAIITLVQVVGTGVAIIMLIVLAIKYISAAPSEKAEIKKVVVIYVVGACILFAATGILQIIKSFAEANLNT